MHITKIVIVKTFAVNCRVHSMHQIRLDRNCDTVCNAEMTLVLSRLYFGVIPAKAGIQTVGYNRFVIF